jgi:5-methylcytosine-specific restriction endonuclease McrA
MSSVVLFLDCDWSPLRVEPWQRAISDIFVGKVEVVEYSRDRTIRGVTTTYPMPAVVRLIRKFRRDRMAIKFSRLNIYSRDRFRCQYCGTQTPTEDLTFDHVMPRSRGGRTCWENIVAACLPCNKKKANRTPEEADMKLLSRPRKPFSLPVITVRMDGSVPPEWKPYWSADLES